ncbi:MAG: hypothetical protein J3Q66DRAFT_420141 [Benniella sp.]|nr:MAG: hypothetical protein J3Q66DRAFT_420141 [Benniella sp.]
MEQEILKAGSKGGLWVYLDGALSKEKESTHAQREATRVESGERAQVLPDILQQRVEDHRSVGKQDFKQAGSMIGRTFYWSLDTRNEFVAYLTEQGWPHVIKATTEADLAIARDCRPNDVVVVRDSDLLIYPSVTKVYRAISKTKYLKEQTNYKIVKSLSAQDPGSMVDEYLAHPQVVLKVAGNNTGQSTVDHVGESNTGKAPEGHFDKSIGDLVMIQSTSNNTQNRPPQNTNRYKTFDHPPKDEYGAMCWNPRYTAKERMQHIDHELPDEPKKQALLKAVDWEHPTSTVDIGTVSANVRGALMNPPRTEAPSIASDTQRNVVAAEVQQCIKDVVKHASETKRKCQLLVAGFIEQIGRQGVANESDKALLDLLCPRIPKKKTEDEDTPENDDSDITLQEPKDAQTAFPSTLLIYLYSGTCHFGSESGSQVERFMNRAHEFGQYPGSSFLEPVASELGHEYRRHFINGTRELQEKKDRLSNTSIVDIDHQASAIEKKHRKIASLSGVEHKFILLTERNLVTLFCKNELLRPILFDLASQTHFRAISIQDLNSGSEQRSRDV